MLSGGTPKPYLDAWLKRTRRALAGSGSLSELSMILGESCEEDSIVWRARLLRILDGEEEPDFDLLMKIDSLLARPKRINKIAEDSEDLFG